MQPRPWPHGTSVRIMLGSAELVCGELLDRDGHLCQATILYEVGDATQVNFWQDWWSGESSLVVCYPELFWICRNKEASVADLMHFTNGVLHWGLHFVWDTRLGIGVFDDLYEYHLWFGNLGGLGRIRCAGNPIRKRASRLVLTAIFWMPLQSPVCSHSLGKEIKNKIKSPFESSLLCMDCSFGLNFDNWQLKEEKGKVVLVVI